MVAEIVEAEENSTSHMRTLRAPPVITINKSAAYALYELTYIRVCLNHRISLIHMLVYIFCQWWGKF